MRKFYILYFLPLLCLLAACGDKTDSRAARLKGEIEGLGDDTLYVVGMDRLFDQVDTLVVKGGQFDDTLSIDTLVGAYLLFGDGTEYPFYADCRERITFKGKSGKLDCLEVTGNVYNEEQTAFQRSLDSLGTSLPSAVQAKAEAFIRSHPASLVSVYLIDKYFVQVRRPDSKRIRELVEPLTGDLRDRPYLQELVEKLDAMDRVSKGRTLPFFQTLDAEGVKVKRTDFKARYLLVHVWASWDEASRAANRALRRLHRKWSKSDNFAMLGISLDIDRGQWLEAVKADTLEWKQTCDLKGWETEAVQKMAVQALPFNVLVSENGRILGIDLTTDEIEKIVSAPTVAR